MSSLVSKKAPDFTASAVLGNGEIVNEFQLSKVIQDKYAILFFYPLDFTFVCPSELIALDRRLEQFKSRNVEVIGISIDSHFTHQAWRKTPIHEGGIGEVGYTLVADINHAICQAYGVEHPQMGVAFRGTYLIDANGIVRSEIINDLPIGRNIDELVRLVDAVQFHEKHGEVCPAGWQKGDQGMVASTTGVAQYLSANAKKL